MLFYSTPKSSTYYYSKSKVHNLIVKSADVVATLAKEEGESEIVDYG
jgi:hypothetical protein